MNPNVILHASQLYYNKELLYVIILGGAFLYSSLQKNLSGTTGIPISPVINQNIGIVWKKGSYTTDSAEKFITYIINKYSN